MSLDHAEHNEKACQLLFKTNEFNDWVVTTAFYSSLHYVNFKLFPLTKDENKYENLSQYYKTLQLPRPALHNVTIELVSTYIKHISSFYRWLYDTCRTARYHNYKVDDQTAKMAILCLNNIKNACIK